MGDGRITTSQRLTFANQNLKFQPIDFTGYVMRVQSDKLGNVELRLTIPWQEKDKILPNITYSVGMPLHVSVEPYMGKSDDG